MKLIDRWIRDITSIVGFPIIVLISIGLLVWGKIEIMWEFIFALIVSELIIYIIRYFYFRPRPIGKRDGFTSLFERLDESSFPSVHAARASVMAVTLSQSLSLTAKIILWVVATTICASRIYLKRHHLSDVIVGGILGLVIGYIAILLI